jgi:hypothetical protein
MEIPGIVEDRGRSAERAECAMRMMLWVIALCASLGVATGIALTEILIHVIGIPVR